MLPTDRLLAFIQQQQLYDSGKKALLAVSGGRDSVLMVKLFNAAGLNFGIAHCNFGLRGEESDKDEVFVERLAKQHDVPFYSITFDTMKYVKETKLSVQMAARELRYTWLEETREAHGYDCIALAHHASDVTETVLLNLTRGTGIAGLHGILAKRQTFIRPLLFLSREEINDIISAEGIDFREDQSNLSSKYARNKIRLEVIPKLKQLNPSLDETFEKNSKRFGQLEEFLNLEIERLRKELFKTLSNEIVEVGLQRLSEMRPLELILYELFKPFNFSEPVLSDLIQTWNGEPGKVFESKTHRLVLDRDRLLLERRESEKLANAVWDSEVSSLQHSSGYYTCKIMQSQGLIIEADKSKAFFDESLLQYPLVLRLWNEGDYFYPLGMKGKKKLGDYLRELKIPLTHKKRIPLLVNGNGDILWVVGHRTDNRYKVSAETKKVIIFKHS